jgi:hypothetical protein
MKINSFVGEALSEPIHWEGSQWAVTDYGVECRDGTYPIEKRALWMSEPEHSWEEHMSEKDWVDLLDFKRAIAFAREKYRQFKPKHLSEPAGER